MFAIRPLVLLTWDASIRARLRMDGAGTGARVKSGFVLQL